MTWLSVAGGIAAVAMAAILLLGVATPRERDHRVRPWLVTLLEINAGRGATRDSLRGVTPTDVALLALATTMYAGFWPGPGPGHVVWMILAIAQPLLGIPLLLVTRMWGRSGLMGGALVLSLLMIADSTWTTVGWLGAASALVLLIADFGTAGRASRLMTVLVTTGYGTLTVWSACVALTLLGSDDAQVALR
jgi:hypothetical protein